ncbi:Rpn family recombination-promoting nuclease/putative transposase [Acaryochloris marina NIES-2412]|uniref:Rpn family recombination-promoting nuclease/putative transposase n=1 Tax=Acaryochloris marina TaxID=155978 RepID=UPI004059179E
MTQQGSIDHDGLFKELIETFFWEFLELFLPQVLDYVEHGPVIFLSQEVYSSIGAEEKRIIDLLAQVQFRGQESYFLFHIEPKSSDQPDFEKRMFYYFGRLHEKHDLPIYPVVIFSYDSPRKAAESSYKVDFPDFQVLQFNFQAIQLNRLNWRDYLRQNNPVASALMAKMQIAREDRPQVKVDCLRMLATLQLDPARTEFISQFVDTYLRLEANEEQRFQAEVDRLESGEREAIMQTLTSWEEKGWQKGEATIVLRQLHRKFKKLSPEVEAQIQSLEIEQLETLSEALLEFEGIDNLTSWLQNLETS